MAVLPCWAGLSTTPAPRCDGPGVAPPRPVSTELNYPTITLATPVNHSQGPVTELSVGDLQVFAGTP